MRFASFEINDRASYGLVRGDSIIDLGPEFGARYPSLKAAIADDALSQLGAWAMDQPGGLALSSIQYLPVIPDADRVACFGLNYRKRNPAGGDVTEMEFPTIFLKAGSDHRQARAQHCKGKRPRSRCRIYLLQ